MILVQISKIWSLCMRAEVALVNLHILRMCIYLPELSMLANAFRTKISCAGSCAVICNSLSTCSCVVESDSCMEVYMNER